MVMAISLDSSPMAPWRTYKLRQISRPVRGGSPRPAGDPRYFNGSFIPWLTVAALTNIPSSQMVVSHTETSLTEEGSTRSRTLEPGTIIIANSGATLGVAKILGVRCCANDGVAALLDLSHDFSPSFLVHLINSKTGYLREVVARGNGQPNLNTTLIGDFTISAPEDRHEQEAIADTLSAMDAFIESLETLVAKKREVALGALQELLSGNRRLPGFSRAWVRAPLGRLLKIRHGKNQKAIESPAGQYPILATGGQIGTATAYLWNKPSVLIGRKGTIDRPQFMSSPFWCVDTLFFSEVYEPNSAKFLFYLFCTIEWRRYSEASGVPSLNARTIEGIEAEIPEPDEQRAISIVLGELDDELSALEARLTKARQIREGMTQELLSGRIRLL